MKAERRPDAALGLWERPTRDEPPSWTAPSLQQIAAANAYRNAAARTRRAHQLLAEQTHQPKEQPVTAVDPIRNLAAAKRGTPLEPRPEPDQTPPNDWFVATVRARLHQTSYASELAAITAERTPQP